MSKPTERCSFCGESMVKAWHGWTPTGYELTALVCPKCFSTRYVGSVEDPVWRMLKEITEAFMYVYRASARVKLPSRGKILDKIGG